MEFQVFRKTPDGKKPPGYKNIPPHMICGVKFDVRRKARFVAGGHLTDDSGEDAYAGVVALEAVRLGMFAALHNNLQVVASSRHWKCLLTYQNWREAIYDIGRRVWQIVRSSPCI